MQTEVTFAAHKKENQYAFVECKVCALRRRLAEMFKVQKVLVAQSPQK